MVFEKIVQNARVIAILCNQFGDSGKGKFSDYFTATWADVCARGTGGNNAGHTVVVGGKEKIFHVLPAGIAHDADGKITILGNGMVLDLAALNKELDELDAENKTYRNLLISCDAHLIMPYHVALDKANSSQKNGGIGTTGRGIGPAYTDKIARKGITVGDALDKTTLVRKLNVMRELYPQHVINIDEIISSLQPQLERIRPFVHDTTAAMHRYMGQGKKILLEGAQGLFLSVEHGTYPYVTSSDCSLNGTATGVGLSAKSVDLPIGIVKFPFMTRVGAGPFPTECGASESENWCAEGHRKEEELTIFNIPFMRDSQGKIKYDAHHPEIKKLINSTNALHQGIGIRLAAGEYGATTGRPRRTGWTDAVAARYAVQVNGPYMILTKPDALAAADEWKICYDYKTPEGKSIEFTRDATALKAVTPQYKTYTGYGDITPIRSYEDLPPSLRQGIEDFETFTSGKILAVSVGADRDATILK